MSNSSTTRDSTPSQAWRIDKLCDQFEAAWISGRSPAISDYLPLAHADERAALLNELIPLEIDYRRRRGELVTADEIARRLETGVAALYQPQAIVVLSVTQGPNRGQQFRFTTHDTFIVGRGSTAHLKLPPRDKFFSRHHFLLEVNPPLCRLTNLSTTNGTLVNGQRVSVASLADGDVILAGDTALRVTVEAASQQPAAPAAPSAPLPAGGQCRLGPYELVRELGRGGMGVVFLARHMTSGQLQAIKMLRSGAAAESELRRFLREATILQRLCHDHIVAHLGGGHERGEVYFVMEYVAGTDALRLLTELGVLPVARAAAWICQLLEALEYAHAQGLVHRDIKPANLLIGQSPQGERLKLADFGLARVYQSTSLSGLTMDGEVGGSLPFMPPEQITHYRSVDARCDLYSAGATLYTLLTGRFVYDFPARIADRLVMILQDPVIDIGARRPDLPPGLQAAIRRALQRNPADRFANAAEMRQAILPYAVGE